MLPCCQAYMQPILSFIHLCWNSLNAWLTNYFCVIHQDTHCIHCLCDIKAHIHTAIRTYTSTHTNTYAHIQAHIHKASRENEREGLFFPVISRVGQLVI